MLALLLVAASLGLSNFAAAIAIGVSGASARCRLLTGCRPRVLAGRGSPGNCSTRSARECRRLRMPAWSIGQSWAEVARICRPPAWAGCPGREIRPEVHGSVKLISECYSQPDSRVRCAGVAWTGWRCAPGVRGAYW